MTVLYPNPCHNKECQKRSALYFSISSRDIILWLLIIGFKLKH